jgi:RHS repeat-associated protein
MMKVAAEARKTAKTGTGGAPSFSATIDAATNRWAGVSHDANGNQLYAPMMAGMPNAFTLGYDVSNRMTLAWNGGKKNEYEYDPGNKRVTEVNYTANGSGDWVKDGEVLHFFGITGQRLATYSVGVMNEGYSTAAVILTQSASWVWFGGKLANGNQDRLGSVGKYLPYGEEKPGATGNPANGTVKFATYVRDAVTGIDYADQRWHTPGAGRFLSADPYQASAGPGDPGSWNRYGYVQGDPVGYGDPRGLMRSDCAATKKGCEPGDWDWTDAPWGGGASGCSISGTLGSGLVPNLSNCYAPEPVYEPPPPPSCLDSLNPRDVAFVTDNVAAAYDVSTVFGGALSGGFILAWAAVESGFGTSSIARSNHNFFGEKHFATCGANGCIPNTNPAKTSPWKGSVPCAQLGGSPNPGFACFDDPTLGASAYAALVNGGGKYLKAASNLPSTSTIAAKAQAIADAGWCKEGRCLGGGYGKDVQKIYDQLVPVLDCLFPLSRLR